MILVANKIATNDGIDLIKKTTYFSRDMKALSVNEGRYPNIHIRWGAVFGFYIALNNKLRVSWFSNIG